MSDIAGAGPGGPPMSMDSISSQMVAQYMAYSGMTLWLWDVLLTIDEEINLIWKRDRSTIKFLYIINRYLPALSQSISSYVMRPSVTPISDPRCRAIVAVVFLTQTIQTVISPTIFVMRVYTISNTRPTIRWLLIAITIISNLYLLAIVCTGLAVFVPTVGYESSIHICLGPKNWMFGAMYYIPVVVDTAVFLATVYHAVSWKKTRNTLVKTSAITILDRLYVDGALYYLIVLSIRVGSCIVFFGPDSTASFYTLSFLDNALTSAVTSRWFLSFRRTLVESLGLESSYTVEASRQDNTPIYSQNHVKGHNQSHGYNHVHPNRKSINVNVSIDITRSSSGHSRPFSREDKAIELEVLGN